MPNLKKCSVDHTKRQLDKFLATVPDEPHIHGYTAQRRAETNSPNCRCPAQTGRW